MNQIGSSAGLEIAESPDGSDDVGEDKPFGLSARADFLLEKDVTYLNHGAFGATSRPVMAAAQDWREKIEGQPSRFLKEELHPALRQTADALGGYVGALGDDIVFLDNASTAINAVLRSLVLFPGDEVIATNLTYGAVMRTLEFVCDRAEARLVIEHLDYPIRSAAEVVETLEDAITPRTRLLVLDHITSKSAAILPVAEIAELFSDRGIPVLVDGAHAPGMLDLDIASLGVTWYTGNCHKWLGSARGAAFLWTEPSRQAHVRPTTISHFVADGYIPAFDWPGTKDFTPYLTVPDAIAFRAGYGEERIAEYCGSLAWDSADKLAGYLGTEIGTPPELTGFMASVALPSSFGPAKQPTADMLRSRIRDRHNLEIDIQAFDGRLWMRLSTYIYNELSDIDRLIDALKDAG